MTQDDRFGYTPPLHEQLLRAEARSLEPPPEKEPDPKPATWELAEEVYDYMTDWMKIPRERLKEVMEELASLVEKESNRPGNG